MNWTGGRLQRHSGKSSRGGGALTNRQKEHFAKVKANIRSGGQRNSPAKWSIFGKVSVDKPQRQLLDSYAGAGRNTEHASSRKRKRSESRHENWDEREEYDDEPPTSASLHREPQARYTNTRSPSVEIVQRSPIPDDDLYNATPPPLRIKRERAVSPELGNVTRNYKPREPKEESIEEKRLKLLSKGDWVGLSIRRLPQLKFNPPKHDEDIGRRRKVKDGHRARYSKLQTRIDSPFAVRKVQLCEEEEERGHIRESMKSDVRISIGGRVVPPGISSSSRRSKVVRQSTPRMMHRILSSDEMLLDDEYDMDGREDLNSDRFLSVFETRIHGSGRYQDSPMSIPSSGNQDTHLTYRYQQRHKNTERAPLSKTNRSGIPIELGAKASPFPGIQLRQPMPTRPAKHPVLHLSSPKCNSSVLAHVGGLKCVVPKDQGMDNETWKTWMAPSTQGTGYYDHQAEGRFANRNISISPGISAIPTFREDTSSVSRFDDENSGGQYEHVESSEGCESSMIQESTEPSDGNCISHTSNIYAQSVSSEYCEIVSDAEVPVASHQSSNEDNISTEPQYIRSSQRASSSIPWDPPQNSSPGTTEPCQRKFTESPQSKTFSPQQNPTLSGKTVEPKDTTIQHSQIMWSKLNQDSDRIKDCPAKSVQKETDQNELWMKFVFDEDSENEDVLSKKTISTRAGANIDMTTNRLPAIREKLKEEPSPTFSTFVHNSVESESPLQPRYVAPTNSRGILKNHQLEDNRVPEDEITQSSGFSTYVHQSNDNYRPLSPSARARGHPHKEKHYQVNGDSGANNRTSVAYPTNSNIPNPSSPLSSESQSVSMIAVPGSQIDVSEPTRRRSFLGTQEKVIFTKPRPFVGLRAGAQPSSTDRIMHIGGGTKKEISSDYDMTLAEDIEDD
ncbi:hypothetical protein NHQ30_007539 [Ciborinia camelliae]|nr:hypothetical protein NHQ30_007539 [Ciborinia camelliae]